MSLSNDLVSQFVKATKDAKSKSETTVYGTVVIYDGLTYVKIDGSDLLTPVSTTADVKYGERVTVLIKNHSATITGNVSSPSASSADVKEISGKVSSFEIVLADKVNTDELNAATARIDTLEATNVTVSETLKAQEADIETLKTDKLDASTAEITYATITDLKATNASVTNLQTEKLSAEDADLKYATITDLKATNVNIENLQTEKLSATDADIKYANIDFTNIDEAAIKKILADSGLIKNAVIEDGTITGELIGVTIKGSLIEGGTVVADKLVIQGTDGLYYKLNTDGVTTEAEQTEYNSLNGDVITAKSITATKISVSDLVAFGATIGGIVIEDGSVHSYSKSGIDNTVNGFYLGKDGQLVFGDSNSYLKYYQDDNSEWHLTIQVDDISLGSSGESVGDKFNDLDTRIAQNENDIILRATKEEVSTAKSEAISTAAADATEKAETSLNSAKEYADAQIKVSADSIELTVSNLQVGGRNLALDTGTEYTISGKNTDNQNGNMYNMSCEWSDLAGKTVVLSYDYTLSSDIALSETSSYVVAVGLHNTPYTRWAKIEDTSSLNGHVSAVYTLPTTGYDSNVSKVGFRTNYLTGTVVISNLILEIGNKATDWTPAPEDMATNASLELKVDKSDNDQIVSMLNASADEINVTGNRLVIDATNFKLAADGTVTAANGNFTGTVSSSKIEGGTVSGSEISGGKIVQTGSNSDGLDGVSYTDELTIQNGRIQSTGNISTGRNFSFSKAYDTIRTIYAQWADKNNHDLIRLYTDGLTMALGWAGSSDYLSRLLLRGQTITADGDMVANDNLSVSGSLSTYGYTVPRIRHGSISVTVDGSSSAEFSPIWDTSKPFPGVPHVTLTVQHYSTVQFYCKLKTVSASGFTAYIYNPASDSLSPTVHWMAMYG